MQHHRTVLSPAVDRAVLSFGYFALVTITNAALGGDPLLQAALEVVEVVVFLVAVYGVLVFGAALTGPPAPSHTIYQLPSTT